MRFFSSIKACRINLASGPGFIHMLHLLRVFSCSPSAFPSYNTLWVKLSSSILPRLCQPLSPQALRNREHRVFWAIPHVLHSAETDGEFLNLLPTWFCTGITSPAHSSYTCLWYLLTGTCFRKHLFSKKCLFIHKLKEFAEHSHFWCQDSDHWAFRMFFVENAEAIMKGNASCIMASWGQSGGYGCKGSTENP